MAVIKINKRENPYTMIDNRCLDDHRLTWKAKGILVYLLSKPNDWKVRVKDLVNKSNEKESAIRNCLKELVEFGYAKLKPDVDPETNKFYGSYYEIIENPSTEENRALEKTEGREKPRLPKTSTIVNTNNISNTNLNSNTEKERKEEAFFSFFNLHPKAELLFKTICHLSSVSDKATPKLNYIKKCVIDYINRNEIDSQIQSYLDYTEYISLSKQFIPNDPIKLIRTVTGTNWKEAIQKITTSEDKDLKPQSAASKLSSNNFKSEQEREYWARIEARKANSNNSTGSNS